MLKSLVLIAFCGFATSGWAQSYDELMQKTQSGMAAYLPVPAPAPVSKPLPAATPAPAVALRTAPAQAIAPRAPLKPARAPLVSGLRLSPAMHGVRKEGNRLIVRYTFETATPFISSASSSEKDFRLLDATERAMVREVLERELPGKIPVQFEAVANPKDAYLRVMAADMSRSRRDNGFATSQELGYATLPNPLGAQLVVGSGICAPLKRDCTLLRSTLRHEMGHVLGLPHAEDAQTPSIMQAVSGRYTDYQPQDIAQLQQRYGTPGGTLPVALAASPAPSPDLLSMLQQMLGQ